VRLTRERRIKGSTQKLDLYSRWCSEEGGLVVRVRPGCTLATMRITAGDLRCRSVAVVIDLRPTHVAVGETDRDLGRTYGRLVNGHPSNVARRVVSPISRD